MNKNYMKPSMKVVKIQQKCQILSGSGDKFYTSETKSASSAMGRGGAWNDDDE